jgi:hypothetical protein
MKDEADAETGGRGEKRSPRLRVSLSPRLAFTGSLARARGKRSASKGLIQRG